MNSHYYFLVIFILHYITKCQTQSTDFITFNEFVVEIIDDVVNKDVLPNKLDPGCLNQLKVWNSSIINNDDWALKGKINI